MYGISSTWGACSTKEDRIRVTNGGGGLKRAALISLRDLVAKGYLSVAKLELLIS